MDVNLSLEPQTSFAIGIEDVLAKPGQSKRKRWPLSLIVGSSIIGCWALVTVIVPFLVGRSPTEVTYGSKLLPPSGTYLFGTDALGRDILVRTAVAFRYDILVALSSVLISALVGLLLGALAGSAPEWLDNIEMGILDVISAFPSFVLALSIAAAFGPSIGTLVISIALVFIPNYARTTRAAILGERNKPYAEAARAMAFNPARIVLVHLLPNSLPYTLTQMAMDVSGAIMITAGLSFLGFGVQPPDAEWGLMINEGNSYVISGQWWVSFFPGGAVLSLVCAFILLDSGLKKLRNKS